jgi:hypothetical protein
MAREGEEDPLYTLLFVFFTIFIIFLCLMMLLGAVL